MARPAPIPAAACGADSGRWRGRCHGDVWLCISRTSASPTLLPSCPTSWFRRTGQSPWLPNRPAQDFEQPHSSSTRLPH